MRSWGKRKAGKDEHAQVCPTSTASSSEHCASLSVSLRNVEPDERTSDEFGLGPGPRRAWRIVTTNGLLDINTLFDRFNTVILE